VSGEEVMEFGDREGGSSRAGEGEMLQVADVLTEANHYTARAVGGIGASLVLAF
jgi:hypothetical protein